MISTGLGEDNSMRLLLGINTLFPFIDHKLKIQTPTYTTQYRQLPVPKLSAYIRTNKLRQGIILLLHFSITVRV